jgi:hypothetical protein
MSSSVRHLITDILLDLLKILGVIAVPVGMVALSNSGALGFVQSLPLYRMDRSDASWFALCTAIYSPILIPAFMLVGAVIIAVGFGIWKGSVLFHQQVILKPIRLVFLICVSLILVWIGPLCYDAYLEFMENLS